jgi:hypothetical protein
MFVWAGRETNLRRFLTTDFSDITDGFRNLRASVSVQSVPLQVEIFASREDFLVVLVVVLVLDFPFSIATTRTKDEDDYGLRLCRAGRSVVNLLWVAALSLWVIRGHSGLVAALPRGTIRGQISSRKSETNVGWPTLASGQFDGIIRGV